MIGKVITYYKRVAGHMIEILKDSHYCLGFVHEAQEEEFAYYRYSLGRS